MMRIGLAGTISSHAPALVRLLHGEEFDGSFRVTEVWGEEPESAGLVADIAGVKPVCSRPEDMIGRIDAAILTVRHGELHRSVSEPFLRAGIPTFIDKPLATSVEDARAILDLADLRSARVNCFSVMPMQESFRQLRKKVLETDALERIHLSGPCDVESPWGGVFFYGVHLVEGMLELGIHCGNVVCVERDWNGESASLKIEGADVPTVEITLVKEYENGFWIGATGRAGIWKERWKLDESPYLVNTRRICRFLDGSSEPPPAERLLQPILYLDAINRALTTGDRAIVAHA